MTKNRTLNLVIQVVELEGTSGSASLGLDGQLRIGNSCFAIANMGGVVVRGNKANDPAQAVRNLFTILTAGPGTGDRGADAEMAVELWVAGTTVQEQVSGVPELLAGIPEEAKEGGGDVTGS